MPQPSMVAVDFTSDATVRDVCSYREASVYPKLIGQIIAQNSLLTDAHANKAEADAACAQAGVAYITGVGHGASDSFPDPQVNGTPIWSITINGYDPNLIKGKIIHLVSCDTAESLGRALADPNGGGAAAFFGYSGGFTWPTGPDQSYANIIFDCDAAIDLALAAGKTAGEAFAAAYQAYTDAYNNLVAAGAMNVAAIVKMDRDILRGPSVDNEYGSSSARLA